MLSERTLDLGDSCGIVFLLLLEGEDVAVLDSRGSLETFDGSASGWRRRAVTCAAV